jgi:hypothetical protein
MALPQRVIGLEPVVVPSEAPRVRRCTFRRLSRLEVAGQATYEASCLYPDRRLPLPLGDLESSAAICAACTADHVFRPDEE